MDKHGILVYNKDCIINSEGRISLKMGHFQTYKFCVFRIFDANFPSEIVTKL